jgi:N-acetylmuramoyl-L-alanine amidase
LEFEFFPFVPHNWRVFKFVGIIFFGALVLLAGCTTPPNGPPPNWPATNEVLSARQNLPPFKRIPSAVKTSPPPVVQPSPPPVTNNNKPPVAPVYTWSSLARWAAGQKIGPPQLLAKSPLTTYAISSDQGAMVLAIGSREATWNGVTLHLGFAPETVDGGIFVHGLDLQKNLEPLLCEPPPDFGTNRVIVIDPGHGGANAGTLSVLDKRPEKQFTLDWARRLKPLLETNGWQVFLTRTNDLDVSLSNRVAFAEAHHADYFISLHFNSAAPDKKQSGLETYCLTPTGMPSTLTRGFADPLFENLPNNNFDAQNLQLAVRLHKTILHASGEEDRGVRRARFIGVLRGQHRPAILIEGGYLSNPGEAEKIEDPEFRQKLAEAIADALR